MTVRKLIAELKKMPPGAIVGFQAHDQSDDELDGTVRQVLEATRECKRIHGVGVVLRP